MLHGKTDGLVTLFQRWKKCCQIVTQGMYMYSRIETRNFVYLARWRGQLMSA